MSQPLTRILSHMAKWQTVISQSWLTIFKIKITTDWKVALLQSSMCRNGEIFWKKSQLTVLSITIFKSRMFRTAGSYVKIRRHFSSWLFVMCQRCRSTIFFPLLITASMDLRCTTMRCVSWRATACDFCSKFSFRRPHRVHQ